MSKYISGTQEDAHGNDFEVEVPDVCPACGEDPCVCNNAPALHDEVIVEETAPVVAEPTPAPTTSTTKYTADGKVILPLKK